MDPIQIARENQPDVEVALEALEEAGFSWPVARSAIFEVFGIRL